MKGLKKIIALFTVVAMLATLGVSVFAADPIYPGTGITISKCEVTDADDNGIFTVTVTYEVEDGYDNEIGVTLLSYTGESLPDVTPSGYTPYEATMQIVGIDQVDQKAGTQTFSFNVTENSGAPIHMAGGDTGIVLIGGDAVTPAAVSFKAPKNLPVADATLQVSYGDYEVQDGEEDITAAVTNFVKNEGLVLDLSIYGMPMDTLSVDDSWVGTAVKDCDTTEKTYNYKVAINVPANVEGDEGVAITSETTLYYYVGAYKTAEGVEIADMTFALDDIADEDALKDAIKAKLQEANVVKAVNGDFKASIVNPVFEDDLMSEDIFDPAAEDDQELYYTISFNPQDNIMAFNDTLSINVPAGEYSDISFKVTVLKDAPTRILGDVNNDTKVNNKDWGIILNHVNHIEPFEGLPTWEDPDVYDKDVFYAADVNKDNKVNNKDWGIILNHVNHIEEHPDLPPWNK